VKVTYYPAAAGLMTIKIKYKGGHVLESPYYVHCPSGRAPIVYANLKMPFGLVFWRNSLFVTDMDQNTNTIFEFPAVGLPRAFKTGLNSPRAISIHAGDFYIADGKNNKIIVVTLPDSRDKMSIGANGKADGQFAVPRQAMVLPDENLLVCDTDNCRLQLLTKVYNGGNLQWQFLKKIGSSGDQPGQFKYPLSTAVSPTTNEIAVADCDNDRIQFFDLNLNYLGKLGKAEGITFNGPNSVTFDRMGNLLVLELRGNCIKVFSPERKLIMALGKEGTGLGELQLARAVAIGPDGSIAVTDTGNKRVLFF